MLHKEDYIKIFCGTLSRLENEANTWKTAIFSILEDRTDSDYDTEQTHDELMTACEEYRATVQAVRAENSQIEIWLDSGIRSGQDVLKAIALGANGTMIGRAFLYGLGAYGEDGVRRALELIYKECDVSMAFCGHTDINKVTDDILVNGTYEQLKSALPYLAPMRW